MDDLRGKRILLPRAASARETLPRQLAAAGAHVEDVSLYDTLPENEISTDVVDAILTGKADAITFTSSSTVSSFVKIIGEEAAREAARKILVASIARVPS